VAPAPMLSEGYRLFARTKHQRKYAAGVGPRREWKRVGSQRHWKTSGPAASGKKWVPAASGKKLRRTNADCPLEAPSFSAYVLATVFRFPNQFARHSICSPASLVDHSRLDRIESSLRVLLILHQRTRLQIDRIAEAVARLATEPRIPSSRAADSDDPWPPDRDPSSRDRRSPEAEMARAPSRQSF